MIFSSTVFLSLFLPIFLGIYYLTPFRWRSQVILIGSYSFYAWWRIDFTLLFAVVTLAAYLISLQIVKARSVVAKKRWLAFGVTINLLTLGYFKYFNFGAASLNAAMVSAGFMPFEAWAVILPIGISFYIFHTISYLIDIYREDAPVPRNFFDFAAFVALFPHLVAGPVLRYKNLAEQFEYRTHTWAKFNEGTLRFIIGFSKKVLIADSVAVIADMAFTHPNPTMAESWLGTIAYTVQLYFDFSGYSDMAIGLALMMGFRFLENFDHPYLSRSITEFWRRWHISLSNWLRDYLYISLGGNRKGAIRTYVNLFLTMLLGGLWHGANVTFLLWGAWHGGLLAFERWRGSKKGRAAYPALIARPLTVLFVMLGWVLFRSPDLASALQIYGGMLGRHGMALSDEIVWQLRPFEVSTLAIALVVMLAAPYLKNNHAVEGINPWAGRIGVMGQGGLCLLFVIGLAKMIAQSFSPFLYFQF